jgi:hypothetical protein
MERAGGPSGQSLTEAALRTLLAQHPDALLAGVDDGGLFVPLPDSLPPGSHPVAVARSALDLV